jgi:hypothetical protein
MINNGADEIRQVSLEKALDTMDVAEGILELSSFLGFFTWPTK